MSKIKRFLGIEDKEEKRTPEATTKVVHRKTIEPQKTYRDRVEEEKIKLQQRSFWKEFDNGHEAVKEPEVGNSFPGAIKNPGYFFPEAIKEPEQKIPFSEAINGQEEIKPFPERTVPATAGEKDDFYRGSFARKDPLMPVYEDVKFTIILLENTAVVEKEKEILKRIVKSLITPKEFSTKNDTTNFLCVINYGSLVRITEKMDVKSFNCDNLFNQEDIGENACLYDALIALEGIVNHNYNVVEYLKFKRVRISNIEIVGIGRGIDNFSAASRKKGIENFEKILKRSKVVTRYFCLDEENFIDVATIGFRSIGAIQRTNTQ